MAATKLPAGTTIARIRLNGELSRRPLFVLYRDGRAVAQSYQRRTLVQQALAA